nr:MAG TPA: GNAT family acetyltransferase [Caudoviricetes sp.]
MNKRIKKKIAKRQIQEKQEELPKQLRKLSPEEIKAIAKMINQAFSNIHKVFSQIFDNLFTFFKNLEVEIEKIERRRTQNVRQRTFQISKHSTHNRFKKARIRNQKSRCSK